MTRFHYGRTGLSPLFDVTDANDDSLVARFCEEADAKAYADWRNNPPSSPRFKVGDHIVRIGWGDHSHVVTAVEPTYEYRVEPYDATIEPECWELFKVFRSEQQPT